MRQVSNNLIMCIALMAAAMIVVETSFANGFVTIGQISHSSKQPQRQKCNSITECSSHFDFTLQATSKRYGAEVRKVKREANRKKPRERAERADKDDDDDDDSSSKSEKRIVAVFKWPFRRIRKVFRS